jgi:serine/threonine-protein kinase
MVKPDDDSASQPGRACLDEQEIVDFASGLLPAARLPEVEEHLATCDKCTELVAAAAPLVASSMEVTRSLHDKAFGPQDISSQPTTPQSGPRSGRDRPLLAPGTPLDNTYQVVRFLGRGGMGDVYEVKHARLAGRYAAKLLSSDLADNAQAFSRFQREALIASGLSHPNIVNVIDFCHLSDGLPCLVMEFLDGVDLAQVLALGQMSLMRTLRLVRQIVSALSTLHGHQIIHRDLKPQNIFVLPEHDGEPERVKLVDFGLAKRSNPSMVVTHDRTLLGTPQYMAPEQALGSAENVGPEADQFSLAAIVFEMLGGRHPFGGEVLSTVLYRIVHEPPTPLASLCPHVPPHVVAAIERALSKDRQARFPSVKAFLQALEGEGPAMSPAPPLTTKKVHRSWYIRREVLASAGVLAVAAGVAGVVRMMRPPPDPPVWRASQGVPQGSDPRKLAPGTSGRAPSPADNLTIEPAGTPPPGTMPQAAVKMPAAAPVRVVREAPPSPPAAREENAADRKTPPHPNVRKKVPVATKPQETKPAPDVTPPPAKPPEPEKGPVLIEKL